MRSRATLVALAALAIALAASAHPAAALDEGWTIERFDAQILIRADASMVVTESIDVDFGRLQKHGIIRDLQIRFRQDDRYDRVYGFKLLSAPTDAAGRPWPYERTGATEGLAGAFEGDRETHIRIGDPDRTVSGNQSYRIAYELRDALNAFADHDELYWNVSGVWTARMRAASVRVQVERGNVTRVACFQGGVSSTEGCRATMRAGSSDMSATRPLAAGEQVTVVVGFPKGVVAEPRMRLEARPHDIDAWWDLTPGSV